MVISTPVIFDCDGVLVDSETIYLETDRECLARIGLHYAEAEYRDRFIGLPDIDFFEQLAYDYQARGLGRFPKGYSEIMKAAAAERILKDLKPVRGAAEFLSTITGKVAVASSSEIASLHIKLKITDLSRYFGTQIFSGEQVERGKPEPDLFLFSAEKIGEKPENCIVVEDSVNGVRAACSAGMEVWGFTGGSHANEALPNSLQKAGAHRVFSSYNQILSYMLS